MAYQHIKIPSGGEKIKVNKDFSLSVPDNPIIPYIEGDGTGVDITPVMLKVVDAAVKKAYGGKKKIVWMEMYAGEKSCKVYGENVWLPEETLQAAREYVVSIKGPLTTPWAAASARSTWRCARSSTCMSACGRSAGSRAYPPAQGREGRHGHLSRTPRISMPASSGRRTRPRRRRSSTS